MDFSSLSTLAAAAPSVPTVAEAFDWRSLIAPAVVAAGVSGIVTTIGFFINRSTSLTMHTQKLDADEKLAERKFEFDKIMAERKFLFDAKTSDRKRRQDLAETVLAGFYEVEAIMRAIRSPMTFSHESESRQKAPNETKEASNLRDTYYVYLARYDKRREEVAALMATRYRMVAWFGPKAAEPFQELHEAISTVLTAAQMLIDWSRDAEGFRRNNLELWQKLEKEIGWVPKDEDEVAKKISEAVAEMEAICRPILEEAPLNA